MRPIAFFFLSLILVSLLVLPVSASSVTMTFDKGRFQTRMNLSVHQNMTRFLNESITLQALQDANMSTAFREALRKADPSASFSDLTIHVSSNATWLNLTITMYVTGISQSKGDIAAVNSTWRAFNVTGDLRAGNLSYNMVGREYFRPVLDYYVNASKFENNPNATIRAVTFFVNETQSVAGSEAANSVGNFTVLDFTSLKTPLEQWTRNYSLSNNTSTWRYTPAVMLAASITTVELNKTITRFADYSYSAELIVPGLAQATGNILRVDVGSGQKEWVMIGAILVSIGFAIAVQIMFRARKKAVKLGRH